MADPAPFKYRAFLSYSHRDKAWGEWLHRALETYRIGRDLVGRTTPAGPVPKTLRPIFRDREDFSAGPSLAAQTIAALEASQFLIVICSPNAAKSEYVNEEVRRFKALGRGDRIIPVIVDGNPGDPDSECFPPALRFKVGPDGGLTGERDEPIAADARSSGDGKELAIGKVVAGLLGVGLDEIIRRAERERRRRTRFWSALAGAFLGLAIIATGSAAYAWQQLKTNEGVLGCHARALYKPGEPRGECEPVLFAAGARHARLPGGGRRHPERDGPLRPPDAAAPAAPDRHADRLRRQLSRARAHRGCAAENCRGATLGIRARARQRRRSDSAPGAGARAPASGRRGNGQGRPCGRAARISCGAGNLRGSPQGRSRQHAVPARSLDSA